MSTGQVTAFIGAVRDGLACAGDPDRAAQQQAYMKSSMPFHGVTAPELRALLRLLLVEHRFEDRATWEATARRLWDEAGHREERYAALRLLRHPAYRTWMDVDLLPVLEHLVRTGAWWDFVDEIASHLVGQVLLDDRALVTPVMTDWAIDDHLWIRRAAMLCQLRHRDRTDTDLLGHVLVANLDTTVLGKEFFIRKAVGWALREHARTDPAWVLDFVGTHADRLSGLARREALKHLG
jgi:3-methyladenine DNA glycosylase AlkD